MKEWMMVVVGRALLIGCVGPCPIHDRARTLTCSATTTPMTSRNTNPPTTTPTKPGAGDHEAEEMLHAGVPRLYGAHPRQLGHRCGRGPCRIMCMCMQHASFHSAHPTPNKWRRLLLPTHPINNPPPQTPVPTKHQHQTTNPTSYIRPPPPTYPINPPPQTPVPTKHQTKQHQAPPPPGRLGS